MKYDKMQNRRLHKTQNIIKFYGFPARQRNSCLNELNARLSHVILFSVLHEAHAIARKITTKPGLGARTFT